MKKETKKGKAGKEGHWVVGIVLRGVLTVTLIVVVTTFLLKIVTRHNQKLAVPDFSGMTIAEAEQIANKNALRLDITDSVFILRMTRGVIFRQNPTAGTYVKKNRRILLTINSVEPKRVAMPSLVGFSLRQAKAELGAKNLHVGRLMYVEDMATNNVLAQFYTGRRIEPGTLIETESFIDLELGLSDIESKTSIPSVIGFSLSTARDIILDNSLNVGRFSFDNTVKNYADTLASFVIRQTPPPSEFPDNKFGTAVDIVLSIDKEKLP